MNNKILLPIVLAFLVILSGSIFGINMVRQNVEKDKHIKEVRHKYFDSQNALNRNLENLELLEEENIVLIDSITGLNIIIDSLKTRINVLEDEKTAFYKKIAFYKEKYQGIKNEIIDLNNNDLQDKLAINGLEDEKQHLKVFMEGLYSQLDERDQQIDALRGKKEKYTYTSSNRQIRLEVKNNTEILKILAKNTKILFKNVLLHKKIGNKSISKLRKNNWNYTTVNINMEAIDSYDFPSMTKMVLKIIETETGLPISVKPEGTKKSLRSSDNEGVFFDYNEDNIRILHSNFEKKNSKNYDIQLYLLRNNIYVPFINGNLPIVRDGKIIINQS